MKQTDILIAGGGIAGLALAGLLGGAGLSVRFLDGAKPEAFLDTTPSGRTVALMNSSINIIRAAGVWDGIAQHAAPLKTMRIVDAGTQADFHASEIGLDQFGYNIPNNILRAALYNAVKKLHIGDTLEGYEAHSMHIKARFTSGAEIRASLIVGADGRASAVRRIAGIKAKERDYGQSAITCLINHSRAHNGTAVEFHRPGGVLALVPMPGNCSAVVWIETPERADALMRLKKGEFTQALQESSQNVHGGITLETNPECWPLHSLKAEKLTAPRMALIAEAAHVISPIAAQGLNLSLRDVAALAETVVDAARAGSNPGIATVLNQYERRRKADIGTRVSGVNTMNRIVSNDIEALKGLRRAGLKILDTLPPLKKTAMRLALAPEIDTGRLARGRSL